MINLILIFLSTIFGFNQLENINYVPEKKQLKYNGNQHVKYPTKEYSTNINFVQNVFNSGHLWKTNYDYTFVVNLSDFDKYTFEYFDFKIQFEILERLVDINNQSYSTKNTVELIIYKNIASKVIIQNQSYQQKGTNRKINYQSLIMAELNKKENYQLTALISNNLANNEELKNVIIFEQRTLNINKIIISLVPKINYSMFENAKITVYYDPTKIGLNAAEINKQINLELVNLLDKLNIDSKVFYYLFSGINLVNSDLSRLSSVNKDLVQIFIIECAKSYLVEKDSFLNTLTSPTIKIEFIQKFNINNLGFKKIIYVDDYSTVTNNLIILNFSSHRFLFDEILFLEKFNDQKWLVKVNPKYNNNIFGELEISLVLKSNNWSESNKENIDTENPSWIDGEKADDNPELKTNKHGKYLKSIILFLISIFMFSFILLPELLKKLKKIYRKNDKI
ncbi:hypothetical protein [Mesoplasma coleopterae]|uniref:hypothetical protein n=1 Tax=Mesoplasma coleopterae TaxID=324078 RepID=UPI0013DFE05E|nr:hypothetical protein [Mesoplasma coleopterae]